MQQYKLTQYSHGAGCGCKIAPKVLSSILHQDGKPAVFEDLIVGNEERDDAAVMNLGDGTAIISTTDFFMPIVDDPFDFGRIAAVNAISDIYAMGGTPLLAIAVLGWPIDKLPPEVARAVVSGGRDACKEAGIPLAGGHSIDSPEPIFGLAVTGRVKVEEVKRNGGATPGCHLFLTKSVGVGILTTAQKKGKLQPAHATLARDSMVKLNKLGIALAAMPEVKAMTDVTGFGILGHLLEMCQASNVQATLFSNKIPLLNHEAVHYYISEGCVPGGTNRNWASYGEHILLKDESKKPILCDPQTSGGLLVAVEETALSSFREFAMVNGFSPEPIGFLEEKNDNHWIIAE